MTKLPTHLFLHLALFPAVCAALAGCGDGGTRDLAGRDKGTQRSDDDRGESNSADGALSLSLDGEIAMAAGETLRLDVVDAAGRALSRKAGMGSSSFEFKGLAYGPAKVMATVFDADGKARYEGSGEAKIARGEAATLAIALREADADGSLVIVIESPKPVPRPRNSLLRITSLGANRVTLRSSQPIPVCNGFETSVSSDGKQTFVTVRSCEPLDVGPSRSEPIPLPAERGVAVPAGAMTVAASPAIEPLVARCMEPKVATSVPSSCIGIDVPPVNPGARYVRQYQIFGGTIDKVIAHLNAIEAVEKPEILPAIACLPFVGVREYSVDHVIGGDAIKRFKALGLGGSCAWSDDFRIDSLLIANGAIGAIARQEGNLVASDVGSVSPPPTGGL